MAAAASFSSSQVSKGYHSGISWQKMLHLEHSTTKYSAAQHCIQYLLKASQHDDSLTDKNGGGDGGGGGVGEQLHGFVTVERGEGCWN